MKNPTLVWRAAAAALLAMVIPSADARAQLVPGLYTGLSLTHEGFPRTYDVLVPASYDGSVAVPLVIDLHGYGRTAEIQRSISGFAGIAETEGFIVAWPQGMGGPPEPAGPGWNAGASCTDTYIFGTYTPDDVGFIRAVVAAISAESQVDPARIYATGISCGGDMTHRLACEAADLFAAAAPFSWPVPQVSCSPSRAMPILMTHSRDDAWVLYPPGYNRNDPASSFLPGAVFGFEAWRRRDGCTASSPDVTENPGPTSVCEFYTTCSGGAEVGLCSVRTDPADGFLGHRAYWPYVTDGFNTQQRAWDFLASFTLPAQPVDGDGDGAADPADNCPAVPNPLQEDADTDSVGDACDHCETIANAPLDNDGDDVDNSCDTCRNLPNAQVAGAPTANRTFISHQRDDDADGRGNRCDFDYNNTGPALVAGDFNDMKFSLIPAPGLMTQNTCGATAAEGGSDASQQCGEFDHDGSGPTLTAADFNLSKAAVAKGGVINTNFPKCAACAVGTGWSSTLDSGGERVGRPVCQSSVPGRCTFAP